MATQDVGDVLSFELGKAIISNAATQILLRQAPQAIDGILIALRPLRGRAAIPVVSRNWARTATAGHHRGAFQALASPVEYDLITTSPHR